MLENREFPFTENDFNYLIRLVALHSGISIHSSKYELVYNRLARRLRELGLKNFAQYCQRLQNGDEQELSNFLNALSTNETSFFRENHHFEFLAKKLLPAFFQRISDKQCPRLRLWSAGCSSGEEPCSIAIVLRENITDIDRWDAKILATDLDSNILDIASRGVYSRKKTGKVSKERLRRWFNVTKGDDESIEINNDIKRIIAYRWLNLMDVWPMQGLFDAIFCRNVTIYFDRSTRIKLIGRFADSLVNNGYLFVGHSESLFGLSDRFELTGKSIYQKVL